MGCYNTLIFDFLPDKELIPLGKIDSFFWEKNGYSRPASSFRFCAVRGEGFYAFLESDESPVLCRYTQRDEPVYTDSCLEVFIAPVAGRDEYINFEMNPNGAYLSQFGSERNGRVFLKELTDIEPAVTAGIYPDGRGWHAELFIPEKLISALYGCSFSAGAGELRGNFYKCADDSPAPHYGAYFPVGSAELGFHNPAMFGTIKINER